MFPVRVLKNHSSSISISRSMKIRSGKKRIVTVKENVNRRKLWGDIRVSLIAQLGKNWLAMQETWVQFLGWEVPLEWGKFPTPVFLGFPGGSAGKEAACNEGNLGLIPELGRSPGGRPGNPLQFSCLEKPHGMRSLVGYSPWGHEELDITEWLSTAQHEEILFHFELLDLYQVRGRGDSSFSWVLLLQAGVLLLLNIYSRCPESMKEAGGVRHLSFSRDFF